ncbi:hypothetical protein DAMDJJ_23915 [Cupriavidus necator]
MNQAPSRHQPDAAGFFGHFCSSFVSETLAQAVEELQQAELRHRYEPTFVTEFQEELADYVGRPSPVYFARRLSEETGGARIFLKREHLNHTGAHKINNVIGQAMLARRIGKRRIIAKTGAGQHGVATATICARYGLECVIYMGSEDIRRQNPNAQRMALLGARADPTMVRDFQTVIGREFKRLGRAKQKHPDVVIACVGGGSNAIGIFHPYIEHEAVRLVGVEAAGFGLDTGKHASSIQRGTDGLCQSHRTP